MVLAVLVAGTHWIIVNYNLVALTADLPPLGPINIVVWMSGEKYSGEYLNVFLYIFRYVLEVNWDAIMLDIFSESNPSSVKI